MARWRNQAEETAGEAAQLLRQLDGLVPGINWRSPEQVLRALRDRGQAVTDTAKETLIPLADRDEVVRLLLRYRALASRASTLGGGWLVRHGHPVTGRIHANILQLGTTTGRMAMHRPNLQNLPRDPRVRACIASSDGRVIVKADFSQIELRLAALIAGDKAMLAALRAGEDLHRRTAATVLGVDPAAVTPAHRQLAKALNFGLLYGMGADRLRVYAYTTYGVVLAPAEAMRYRELFFAAYPGLRRWHERQPRGVVETRTLAGRRRLGVERFTDKLNSPVQGSGADVLKLALARLWESRELAPSARLLLSVHDELVVECPVADADAVATWLSAQMTAAMVELVGDAVSIVVDTAIGATWAGDDPAGPR
jgi:DNA polymerase-1